MIFYNLLHFRYAKQNDQFYCALGSSSDRAYSKTTVCIYKEKDFIKWAILDLFFLFVSSNFNTVDNKRSI